MLPLYLQMALEVRRLHILPKSDFPLKNLPKPHKQYTTTMIWCGKTCYDTVGHVGRSFFPEPDGVVRMEEVPYPQHLPYMSHTEIVTVTIYSNEPRIWSENEDLFMEIHVPK